MIDYLIHCDRCTSEIDLSRQPEELLPLIKATGMCWDCMRQRTLMQLEVRMFKFGCHCDTG